MMTGMLGAEMTAEKGTFYSAKKGTKRAGVDRCHHRWYMSLYQRTKMFPLILHLISGWRRGPAAGKRGGASIRPTRPGCGPASRL